eukprot:SAG11_NODE_2076_length_3856_cov_15.369178_2_plen_539_part_00
MHNGKEKFNYINLISRCLHELRLYRNARFVLGAHLSHSDMEIYTDLQSALGYVYLHLASHKLLRRFRPHVLHPLGRTVDTACVYAYLQFDGRLFYVGQTTSLRRRMAEHLTAARKELFAASPSATDNEAFFHRRLGRAGPGSFLILKLHDYGAAGAWPTWHGQEGQSLLKRTLLHQESYYISIMGAQEKHGGRGCLNHAGTGPVHRAVDSLLTAPSQKRPRRAKVLSQRRCRVVLMDGRLVTRKRSYMRAFEVTAGVCVQDFYLLLHAVPATSVPICVRVHSDGVDLTRYNSIQRNLGQSTLRLWRRDGTSVAIYASALIRTFFDDVVAVEIHSVVHRPTVSARERAALALLSWSFPAQQAFFQTCTLVGCHYAWQKARRIQGKKVARGTRVAQVIALCRRKFGLHPSLRFTLKVETPYFLTRAQVKGAAVAHLQRWSPVDAETTAVIVERLRVVYTRTPTVESVFDTVRRHMATHNVGQPRECRCRKMPGVWRYGAPDGTGCVCFFSAEYHGPNAEVLHQSRRTALYPEYDGTNAAA